jgi:hypothetical protein
MHDLKPRPFERLNVEFLNGLKALNVTTRLNSWNGLNERIHAEHTQILLRGDHGVFPDTATVVSSSTLHASPTACQKPAESSKLRPILAELAPTSAQSAAPTL